MCKLLIKATVGSLFLVALGKPGGKVAHPALATAAHTASNPKNFFFLKMTELSRQSQASLWK